MNSWLILTATLPTAPSGLRVRVWRSLKATHCATLREGVYILPAHAQTASAFPALDITIREAGAESYLLEVPARDAAQEATFRALFDRSEQHAEFRQTLKDARKALASASEAQAHKALRRLDLQLQELLEADFFPGKPAEQAQAGLQVLRAEIERRCSPDEPVATSSPVARLDIAAHQGRTWATRARPWVDRLATAWLISRFVDRQPKFIWLASVQDTPADALGFDFDGAHFTHVGEQAQERVSFEVVMASFGLEGIPGLQPLAALVHVLDVGGVPLDEAPGLEALVRGLRTLHADDDALLAAALPVFDALLAGLSTPSEMT